MPEVEAVVPTLREGLPALAPEAGLSEAQLTVIGLPSEGPGIEALESSDGSPMQVAALSEGQGYLSADAADNLGVTLGDQIQVFAGPQPQFFTVAGIYDQGDHPAGSVSMVIPLPAAQQLLGASNQINQVLISNAGGTVSGAEHTDLVLQQLESVVAGTDLEVAPVKQDALDAADEAGAGFSTIFILFAQFSVAAGVLLIFLIFVMLAAERKHELGIARAVGAQRGHVIRVFTFEGAFYAVLAAAVGSLLGVAVGYAMVFILQTAFSQIGDANGSLELSFAFNWKSVVIAYTMGVVLTFLVVMVSSWRVSRLNIVGRCATFPNRGCSGVPGRTWPWASAFLSSGCCWHLPVCRVRSSVPSAWASPWSSWASPCWPAASGCRSGSPSPQPESACSHTRRARRRASTPLRPCATSRPAAGRTGCAASSSRISLMIQNHASPRAERPPPPSAGGAYGPCCSCGW